MAEQLPSFLPPEVQPRPLASAEAGWGLARIYTLSGQTDLAHAWSSYALTVYPQVIIRPFAR